MDKCRRQCYARIKAEKTAEQKKVFNQSVADSIRLNLEDIDEFPQRLTELFNEYLKCDLSITQWNVRFTERMSNTHSCPIGGKQQWRLKEGEKRIRYKGWTGSICGSMKALKDEDGFSRGFTDFFRNYGSDFYVRGFYTGSGGGGSKDFQYSCDIYLDDYPLLKDKYEKYIKLQKEHERYEDKKKALWKSAEEMVQEDQKLKDFYNSAEILRVRIKQIERMTSQRITDIRSGAEYMKAIQVPQEYQYDQITHYTLGNMFKR